MFSWTWHIILGGVNLLQYFDMSLRCRDMMEDDISFFKVRSWTWHVILGEVRILQFFDMSLRCRDMTEDDLSIF